MASSKKVVVRSAKSTTRYTCIKLSQIVCDKQNDYCHRQSDALKDDRLAPLADNIVSEGQGTPMTVYDSGKRDPILGIVYVLIGGFRRFFALLFGIKQNLDHNRINEDMEIDVVEIVQGTDQTDEEFQQDLLVRSIAENEQRVQFTTNEKLEIVLQCKASRIPNPRAASALAMSESQFGRFAAIVERDWLHDYVAENCIGATDAAALIQLANKKDRVEDLRKHLDSWVAAHQAMIDAEAEELRQIKKKLSGSAAHVKKYASPKLMKYWQDCLEHGRSLDNNVDLVFGIRIDRVKGTIEIPATTLKIAELSSDNFVTVIAELQEKADACIPLLCQRRILEQSMQLSQADVERVREGIRQQRRHEKEERAKAEAGKPAPDFNTVDDPRLKDIDEAIGDDNENLDDDVDESEIIDTDESEDDVDVDTNN